jgi:hypothetical protein
VNSSYNGSRLHHVLKQIQEKLQKNNLNIPQEDKGKILIIIDKKELNQKIHNFLKENGFEELKNPTEEFQKQLQRVLSESNNIININIIKQHKTIRTNQTKSPITQRKNKNPHKENNPIRPVVNSIRTPSYKIAKLTHKPLADKLTLTNEYNMYNSKQVAVEMNNMEILQHHSLTTLDIKDLYVNLPKQEIINITCEHLTTNGTDNCQNYSA